MGTVIGGGLKSFLHRQAREQAMNVTAEAQDLAASITGRTTALASLLNCLRSSGSILRSSLTASLTPDIFTGL